MLPTADVLSVSRLFLNPDMFHHLVVPLLDRIWAGSIIANALSLVSLAVYLLFCGL